MEAEIRRLFRFGQSGIGAPLSPNRMVQNCGTKPRELARLAADPWRIPIVVPGCADAGVDRDGRPGDPGGERRRDEGDCRRDVARHQHATERVALGVGAENLVAIGERRQPSLEEAGRQRDARADAITGPGRGRGRAPRPGRG